MARGSVSTKVVASASYVSPLGCLYGLPDGQGMPNQNQSGTGRNDRLWPLGPCFALTTFATALSSSHPKGISQRFKTGL